MRASARVSSTARSVFVVCCLFCCSAARLDAQTAPVEPLRTAGDRPFDIEHIRLDLTVDLPKKTIAARATLTLRVLRGLHTISLDAVEFEVSNVFLNGADKPARFHHDDGKLVIDTDLAENAAATVRVDYKVREPRNGLFFFGPTEAEPDVPLTVWSQGEPITNRFWFPCLDQPNQRQTTELFVTVADGFEAISNGKLVSRTPNPDKTVTFHWKQDKPHVSYLVTLVVGRFDVVEEKWNELPVSYYVAKGRSADVARTFGRTRPMLDFFSRRFGIDYPWDKYSQIIVEQFSGGGMENTSATTLTDRSLHDERALLDSSPDPLIAHELAHQWWGDLVTCRDWAHIWLNEGFATFAEVLWCEHDKGRAEGEYLLVLKGRLAMTGGKDRPIVDRRYSSPTAMFDARAYPKGGWVLHMLRRRLGDDSFWRAVRLYGTEHRFKSVETADFRRVLERATGQDLERFFYDWTERAGHPVLEISSEVQRPANLVRVQIKQTQAGEPFHFPLRIELLAPTTKSRTPPVDVLVTEKEQTLYLRFDGEFDGMVVDPGQTVLAEINETKSREAWVAQLERARSVPARIRAAVHFGKSKSSQDREELAKALRAETFWGVQVELTAALGESGGDTSRDALIQGLTQPNPRVRKACVEHLGSFRTDATAIAALKDLLHKGDASYFVEAAALTAYAKLEPADTRAVLLPWLGKPSHNEVLRVAALEGIGSVRDPLALDTLSAWTRRGKPRVARIAALNGLAKLSQLGTLSDAQQRQLVDTIALCFDGETPPVRRAAVTALRDLGRTATPALSALETLARHDPDERVRDLAKKAGDQVRTVTPLPTELARLREELDKVRAAQDQLRDKQLLIEKNK